jgi:hypothetical protein
MFFFNVYFKGNKMLPILPFEIIFDEICSYLSFKCRAITVSRGWLYLALMKRPVKRKWRPKVLLYSYLKSFGREVYPVSWHFFCVNVLKVTRRTRNVYFRLTWKAAAANYFSKKCRGCGNQSSSNVFGTVICMNCRRNRCKKHCYMVSVGEARAAGVPKKILDSIPWHGSRLGTRLRFWKDIEHEMAQFRPVS